MPIFYILVHCIFKKESLKRVMHTVVSNVLNIRSWIMKQRPLC